MSTKVASLYAEISADTSKLKNGLKETDGLLKNTKVNFSNLAAGAVAAAGIIGTFGAALKTVYDIGKEGAQLELTAGRFDRLSESIGTTSDVLLGDLKDATKGLMSDAQLMQSATDLMSLGLVKTHDEAVRLTAVAGQLGMNMNQLVLTLTNQTTMRFDALGVSVDGFQEKVDALKDAGMDANEAFSEAFLQQAEEQLGRVGGMAETSAGQIAQMEAAWQNMVDTAKAQVAPAVAQVAKGITAEINATVALNNAVKAGIVTKEDDAAIMQALKGGLIDYAGVLDYVTEKTEEHAAQVEYLQGALGPLAPMYEDAAVSITEAGNAAAITATQFEASAEQIAAAEMDAGDLEKVTKDVRDRANEAALAYNNLATEVKNITSQEFAKLKITGLENLMAVETDPAKIQAYADEIKEINLRYGFATESGYALAGAITYIDQMTADGVLSAGSYSEALDIAKKAAADGTLTYGELTEALETAGLTVTTTADIMNAADLDPIIEDTGTLAGNLAGIAGADTSKTFSYKINVTTSGPIGLLGQGGFARSDTVRFTEGGEAGPGFASGGSFVVPPGYPNDSYPMRVETGEHVEVTPAGQTARGDDTLAIVKGMMDAYLKATRVIVLEAIATGDNR